MEVPLINEGLDKSNNNGAYRASLNNPFQSFWMGGFECSDKINCHGQRVDILSETEHIAHIRNDYELLKQRGITTVREGIRWSIVESKPYCYDFGVVKFMMETAQELGIQQIWDICHFGFPDDLSPLHPQFTNRFVSLCRAFVNFFVQHFGKKELIVTPINEVSFLSWLGGEAAGTVPFCKNEAWNIKYKLMHAYIESIKCMKEIHPELKILTTEPLVNIVPDLESSDTEIKEARAVHRHQFQVLDMLTGKMCPELGGKPGLIDIVGLNFYYNNQWIYKQPVFLPWANEFNDLRWRSLHTLLQEVHERYSYPIILAETSHPGIDRAKWIRYITQECAHVIENGLPFFGICIYPIIDRPDWDDLNNWHHAGLWDYFPEDISKGKRVLNEEYDLELNQCYLTIEGAQNSKKLIYSATSAG